MIKNTYLKGRKPEELMRFLENEDINLVIDIRYTTWMPIYFRPSVMKQRLEEKGVKYIYCRKLGNPSELRKRAETESIEYSGINLEKKNLIAKNLYLEHLNSESEIVLRLIEYVKNNSEINICFICSCNTSNQKECHRFWLIEKVFSLINKENIRIA